MEPESAPESARTLALCASPLPFPIGSKRAHACAQSEPEPATRTMVRALRALGSNPHNGARYAWHACGPRNPEPESVRALRTLDRARVRPALASESVRATPDPSRSRGPWRAAQSGSELPIWQEIVSTWAGSTCQSGSRLPIWQSSARARASAHERAAGLRTGTRDASRTADWDAGRVAKIVSRIIRPALGSESMILA